MEGAGAEPAPTPRGRADGAAIAAPARGPDRAAAIAARDRLDAARQARRQPRRARGADRALGVDHRRAAAARDPRRRARLRRRPRPRRPRHEPLRRRRVGAGHGRRRARRDGGRRARARAAATSCSSPTSACAAPTPRRRARREGRRAAAPTCSTGPALTRRAARRARSPPGRALAAELARARRRLPRARRDRHRQHRDDRRARLRADRRVAASVTVGRGTGLDAAGRGAQARRSSPRRSSATARRCAPRDALLARRRPRARRARRRGRRGASRRGCRSCSTATRSAPPRSPRCGLEPGGGRALVRRRTARPSRATRSCSRSSGSSRCSTCACGSARRSGALLALPIVEAAGALHREMATFEEAGVAAPRRLKRESQPGGARRARARARRVRRSRSRSSRSSRSASRTATPTCAPRPRGSRSSARSSARSAAACAPAPSRSSAPTRRDRARRSVVLVAVTGALHQDGLADTADGLGVRGDRERRLAVMRDSATGVFGTLALIGWALLLTSARVRPARRRPKRSPRSSRQPPLGRWAALVHARGARPARSDGLGARFAPRTTALDHRHGARNRRPPRRMAPQRQPSPSATAAITARRVHSRAIKPSAGAPATRSARPSPSPKRQCCSRCSRAPSPRSSGGSGSIGPPFSVAESSVPPPGPNVPDGAGSLPESSSRSLSAWRSQCRSRIEPFSSLSPMGDVYPFQPVVSR